MEAGDADGFNALFQTARALGEETRFRIYRRLFRSPGASSVSELAAAFDLHPNAIRAHLNRLEQAGLVISTLDRSNGAGRPRRLFRPSPEPVEFAYPPRTLKPLVTMLSHVVDTLPAGRGYLKDLGRRWGLAWAAEQRSGNGAIPRGRRPRAELLARQLAAWGWEPTAQTEPGEIRLAISRCLFDGLDTKRDGRCCALEEGLLTGLVEGMLGDRATVNRLPGCRLEVAL